MTKRKTYIKFLGLYEKDLSKKIKKKGLTITVSGLSGSGKSLGAKSIAKSLKLKYFYAGKIQRLLAKEKGISLVEQAEKRGPEVDFEMDRTTLKLAMKGNVVLDGRLTGWVAGDWADVKIYYYCPLRVRAERVAGRDRTTPADAKRKIKKRDREDHEKYLKYYCIDSYDKSIYDIIIKNEKFTKEKAKIVPVKLVKEFLKKK